MASVGVMQDTAHPLLPTASSSSTSSTGPRFRPYASPTHHVTKGRYITSNDARGYIPVYEYPLNGQWIMMDIDDGYILWTGIWKALGNSKADIVKMIDSQPDLAPLIRRVRGGYLKIQGTWMPYEVALKLSRRVAWSIRDDLIPLFGPTFPSTCLAPDQPGYGQVVPSGAGRRRARRATQAQGANFGVGVGVGVGVGGAAGVSGVMQMQMQMPVPVQRGGGVGGQAWTVVTPSVNGVQQHYQNQSHQNQPPLLHPVHPVQYAPSSSSPYSPHETQRYPPSSYPHSHPPTSFRKPSTSNSSNSKMGLSLDIRALSVREPGSGSGSTAPSPHDAHSTAHSDPGAPIRLPPIQIQSRPHGHGQRGGRGGGSPQAAYALPPISAMAEAGFVGGFGAGGSSFGSGTGSASGSVQDSAAAVLRRLRMSDEEAYGAGRVVGARSVEDLGAGGGGTNGSWGRRHSLSVHPATSRSVDTSPRFQPYTSPRSPRSYHEHDRERDRDREYERDRDRPHRPRSSSSSTSHSHSHHHHPYHNSYHQRSYNHHHHRAASPHSRTEPEHDREPPRAASTSHEGDSTSNPSPTSPTTPNSLLGHEHCDSAEREHAHHHYGAREKHLPRVAGRLDEHDDIDKRWPLSPSPHEVTHSADSDDGHVHARLAPPSSFPPRRSSYEVQSDSEMEMATHPHRPW